MGIDDVQEFVRARRERDFYGKLLELGTKDELAPFLEEALSMIVDIAGARRGYLEIRDDGGEADHPAGRPGAPADDPPRFWIARGCTDEDVEEIRSTFSRGVIAEAVATGETIV